MKEREDLLRSNELKNFVEIDGKREEKIKEGSNFQGKEAERLSGNLTRTTPRARRTDGFEGRSMHFAQQRKGETITFDKSSNTVSGRVLPKEKEE